MNDNEKENMMKAFIKDKLEDFYTFSALIKSDDQEIPHSVLALMSIFLTEAICGLCKVYGNDREVILKTLTHAVKLGFAVIEMKEMTEKMNDDNRLKN